MDYDKLLTLSGELGYHLLLSGAEIYRVEESVRYLLQAYGAGPGEVFAIPNCIIVGISSPGQKPLTRMRRVGPHGTNVRKIEALNALCRCLCAETPDLDQAWEALFLAVSLLQRGIRLLGASSAALFSMLEPITSVAVGCLALAESVSRRSLLGCALILAGVALTALAGQRQAVEK